MAKADKQLNNHKMYEVTATFTKQLADLAHLIANRKLDIQSGTYYLHQLCDLAIQSMLSIAKIYARHNNFTQSVSLLHDALPYLKIYGSEAALTNFYQQLALTYAEEGMFHTTHNNYLPAMEAMIEAVEILKIYEHDALLPVCLQYLTYLENMRLQQEAAPATTPAYAANFSLFATTKNAPSNDSSQSQQVEKNTSNHKQKR